MILQLLLLLLITMILDDVAGIAVDAAVKLD